MEHEAQPAFRKRHLIWLGGVLVIGSMLAGLFIADVDGLIRNDVTLGPVIAATKIVIPIFMAVGFIYWLVLLFTGKLNRDLYGMMVLHERYNARASGFLLGFSEVYPPFNFKTGGADNDAYSAVTLNLPEPPETGSRKLALNFLLAIPHYIVLAIIGIGAFFVAIAAWFAVLFTGSWPEGMRGFLVRFGNYYFRVWLYATMVETEYPKFGLSAV